MSREQKAQLIDSLEEEFSNCSIGILTDYRGLSMAEITALRRKLQGSNCAYRVVKNTLARFAAERIGRPELARAFRGPVAVATGQGDVTAVARALAEFIRTSGSELSITAGFMGERVLTAGEVSNIAALPSREVLLSRVVGGMQAPIYGLVSVLAAPLRGLAGVLQARIDQLEGAENG